MLELQDIGSKSVAPDTDSSLVTSCFGGAPFHWILCPRLKWQGCIRPYQGSILHFSRYDVVDGDKVVVQTFKQKLTIVYQLLGVSLKRERIDKLHFR